jgi:large subunit ribosomal protein L21
MYAIIETGGRQFNVEVGSRITIPRLEAKEGDKISIDKVLVINDGDNSHIGTPYIDQAKIEAVVLGESKGDKVTIFKFKRRTKYRRTRGHRQDYSEIEIKKIVPPSGK